MKRDTIIIGGGLSGLTCGIALARAGKRVAIVGTGQSTLHFGGGSLGLLGMVDGKPVERPLEAMTSLPAAHPYSKIGHASIAALATEAASLLTSAGIPVTGDAQRNHYRLSPIGVAMEAWLTLPGYFTVDNLDELKGKQVAVANIIGFNDLPSAMLCDGLRQLGCTVNEHAITTPQLMEWRRTPSEMRATNVSRLLAHDDVLNAIAAELTRCARDAQLVLIPAVVDMLDGDALERLMAAVGHPVRLVATLPPSLGGARIQEHLVSAFTAAGGTYLLGDTVTGATGKEGHIDALHTANLGENALTATNYVLATGSFLSRGLVANYHGISEPIFGLDTDAPADREQWTQFGILEPQQALTYGVLTDDQFRGIAGGKAIDNLRVIGSILSDHDTLGMGDGGGVDMLTALHVAHALLN